jgi:hypothetical protein
MTPSAHYANLATLREWLVGDVWKASWLYESWPSAAGLLPHSYAVPSFVVDYSVARTRLAHVSYTCANQPVYVCLQPILHLE